MWLYLSENHDPTWNLAIEELFFHGKQDICMLYINQPSVILGCNQAWENEIDINYCNVNNIQIIRRISGGGAVYHDEGNLNYSFITNRKSGEDKLSGSFLEPVISTLNTLNIPAIIGKRKDLWLPAGYKISGTASHISAHRAIHHGTLLYNTNLNHLENALQLTKTLELKNQDNNPIRGIASVPSPVKNISSFLQENNFDSPEPVEFFHQFSKELIKWFTFEGFIKLNDFHKVETEKLIENKYNLKSWNFRK